VDPFTLAIIAVVFFILFLMISSGGRKHRLEQALKELETERLKLMKSIQHIKVSFYKKQLTEEEAQKQMFSYEEKLRDVESRILQIKEKPLMRTLEKQKAAPQQEEGQVQEEIKEVVRAERAVLSGLDTKVVIILFFVAVIGIAMALTLSSRGGQPGESSPAAGSVVLPMTARTSPEDGTYPGSTAGLRVRVENSHGSALRDIRILAKAPDGSGIRFSDGELALQMIPELEPGGMRDLFYMMSIDKDAPEGDYRIIVAATSDDGLVSGNTSARLIVRVGISDRE
jgi:hypothetical protein